jgi:hypothetical protein
VFKRYNCRVSQRRASYALRLEDVGPANTEDEVVMTLSMQQSLVYVYSPIEQRALMTFINLLFNFPLSLLWHTLT